MAFDFSKYAAVLLDLDGTLYHVDHPLPGAPELVARLASQGRLFACLTNSTAGPADLSVRLAAMGMRIEPRSIYSAAGAACDYVLQRFGTSHRPRVFNLATDSVRDMLEGRVQWVNDPAEPCDAVIVGTPTNPHATEDRRRTAMLLLRAGAQLVGTCADRVFPSRRGLEFGAGALCSMLAYAADVEPFYTGKPLPVFFEILCRRLGVNPADCLLIGDNLESDIAGGKVMGMHTILTLTGVSRREDVQHLPANRRPDAIIDDLRQLPDA